jgi:hypothetical protein
MMGRLAPALAGGQRSTFGSERPRNVNQIDDWERGDFSVLTCDAQSAEDNVTCSHSLERRTSTMTAKEPSMIDPGLVFENLLFATPLDPATSAHRFGIGHNG